MVTFAARLAGEVGVVWEKGYVIILSSSYIFISGDMLFLSFLHYEDTFVIPLLLVM